MPFLLHAIFQRHGIPPDEVYAKPKGAQRFMYASMALVFEEEEGTRREIDNAKKGR